MLHPKCIATWPVAEKPLKLDILPWDLHRLKGQEAVVKLLIGSDKVDVDSKNSYSQTPLLRGCLEGIRSDSKATNRDW
jgi:hypothetical protein